MEGYVAGEHLFCGDIPGHQVLSEGEWAAASDWFSTILQVGLLNIHHVLKLWSIVGICIRYVPII